MSTKAWEVQYIKFNLCILIIVSLEFFFFRRFSFEEYKVLLSLFVGIFASVVFLNYHKKGFNVRRPIVFSIFFLGMSQIFQYIGIFPDSILLNPKLPYYDSRYAGLGHVDDNGLLYLLAIFAISPSIFSRLVSSFFLIINQAAAAYALFAFLQVRRIFLAGRIFFVLVLIFIAMIFLSNDFFPFRTRLDSLEFRFVLWSKSITNFFSKDIWHILFGVGVAGGRELTLPIQNGNPHSNYLGLLFYYGLITLPNIIYFIVNVIKRFNNIPVFIIIFYYGIVHEFFYSAGIILVASIAFQLAQESD